VLLTIRNESRQYFADGSPNTANHLIKEALGQTSGEWSLDEVALVERRDLFALGHRIAG
jgi:hypothetical protein